VLRSDSRDFGVAESFLQCAFAWIVWWRLGRVLRNGLLGAGLARSGDTVDEQLPRWLESSAGRQRLGAISKQGNSMMRYLLVEAAQMASRLDPELRRDYQRLKFRRGSAVAKVAIARKLAVRLYWKLREAAQPVSSARMQGSPVSSIKGVKKKILPLRPDFFMTSSPPH
jgi:Transposase IS116/IS110/IS902 family